MRRSLARKITSFFILICIVPFTLFTLFFVQESRVMEEKNMKESLSVLVKEKAYVISKDLTQVEREAENLAQWTEYILREEYNGLSIPEHYSFDNRGVLGRIINEKTSLDNISNVYVPNNIKFTEEVMSDLINTEKLDSVFGRIKESNTSIEYVYMVSNNGFIRVYPYLPNVIFNPDHDQRKDPFYTLVEQENKDKFEGVWTKPYYDYAGNGWVITRSHPVYVDGIFKGIVCIDVSLNEIKKTLADFSLGDSGFAFIIDSEGNIIYHPEYMRTNSVQGELLNINILKQDISEDYEKILSKMIIGEDGISSYSKGEESYIVSFEAIHNLDWKIGIEVNKNYYVLGFKKLASKFWLVTIFIILILLVMGILVSFKITNPILKLTQDAKKIASGKFGETVSINSKDEIGVLAESFNTMSKKIEIYTENIIRNKNQLETVFNSFSGIMMVLSPNYKIIRINQQGLNIAKSHLKTQDIVGMFCYQVFNHVNCQCEDCPVKNTLKFRCENKSEILRGTEVYHLWSFPVYNSKGNIEEIVLHSRKVTEQIMIEKELIQAEKMAAIGQMATGVTHELKNPLAVIKGATYLLNSCEEINGDEVIKESIEEIVTSIARAEKIIYNLLDFSNPSNENMEEIEVGSLIEQILLLERRSIIKGNIELVINFPKEPLYIFGKATSIKHAFLNLITNAIQAMPKGGRLDIIGKKLNDEKIEICFSDTGIGIVEENLIKIFKPFFTTKKSNKGTGLGLWIVNREVEKHGGEITVQSKYKQGTIFRIVLPSKERCDTND
jgi:two-component system NtrC family sensor kinase